jgi:hypothetical protein
MEEDMDFDALLRGEAVPHQTIDNDYKQVSIENEHSAQPLNSLINRTLYLMVWARIDTKSLLTCQKNHLWKK